MDGVLILTVGGREGQMSLISGGLLFVGRVIVMLHGRADSIYSRCECVTSNEAPFLRPCNVSSLEAVCGASDVTLTVSAVMPSIRHAIPPNCIDDQTCPGRINGDPCGTDPRLSVSCVVYGSRTGCSFRHSHCSAIGFQIRRSPLVARLVSDRRD